MFVFLPHILPCLHRLILDGFCGALQKGETISNSNTKFSAGDDGSLHVVAPSGDESGEYMCTATNTAGHAKRKVQLTVYGA